MADKSIGDLDRALQINDNDLFVLEQSGAAKSLTGKKVKDYVYRDIDNASATTLPSGSEATASYNSDTHTMAFGIPAGKSAYEAAVEGGYTETETQFNHDLSGIDEVVKYDNGEIGQVLPLNADQLNGHPDSYFAKQDDMTAAEQSIAANTAARHTHSNKSILDSITQETLNDIVKYDNDEFASPLPLNADRLNGHSDSYFAKQADLTTAEQSIAANTAARHTHANKSILDQITQAMLNLIGTIAEKYSAANPPPYPVTSVNGNTGNVVLNYITFDEEEES